MAWPFSIILTVFVDVTVPKYHIEKSEVNVSFDEIVRRMSPPENMTPEDVCKYLRKPTGEASHIQSIRDFELEGRQRGDRRITPFSAFTEGNSFFSEYISYFYRPQTKFAMVMFLHLSVILFTGGGGLAQCMLG